MFRVKTIGQRLDAGETVGFDYLRLGLALAVMGWHTLPLNDGVGIDHATGPTLAALPVRLVLPLFFALSGVLVASSLARIDAIKPFLVARGLRIVPALFVEVALSALVLGPLLTTTPLATYFTSHDFWHYFANIAGDIHYRLPGVFTQNIYPNIVNGSLWTIPFELRCYIALALIYVIAVRLLKLRIDYLLAAALIAGTAAVLYATAPTWSQVSVDGNTLVLCFLAGNLVFCFRHALPTSPAIILAVLAACLLLLVHPWSTVLAALPVAYLAALAGCTTPPKLSLLRSGDYSYGIYLYAFPMQQTAVHFFGDHRPLLTLFAAVVMVSGFSVFSWHVIEKPALRLKRLLLKREATAKTGRPPAQGAVAPPVSAE